MLKRALLWLRSNLERRRYEQEMRDEMNEHLDRATRLRMDRGLPVEEARRQARREFGDVAYHQTEARDARGTLWLDDLQADSRFAVRHFARKPGTTIMMFVVLAAGMCISTLLFSWVHALAVKPPSAVVQKDDLVRIRGSDGSPSEPGIRRFQEDEFLAYRGLTSQFESVAGYIDQSGVLQVPGDPEQRGHPVDLAFVTENYFRVLGVQPILGAGLPREATRDASANVVGVIDHETWKDLFGQRSDIIGSTATINGIAITIVGVAPVRFHGAGTLSGLQIWLPLEARHMVLTTQRVEYSAVARLRAGATSEAATAAVRTIAARIDTVADGSIDGTPSTEVVPVLSANSSPEFDQSLGMIALSMSALGTLVLLVTCTNVSALLTGLASARRQEIAVRLSLGAARTRIIRQLLTESAVLAVVAGVAALALVGVILKVGISLVPDVGIDLGIQWPTMAFTFAVALAVGVVFGLSPALHATRLAVASVLRDSSGGIASSRARLQRGLVVAQIAFTQPLIVLMATMLVFFTAVIKPVTSSDSADRVVELRVQTPSSVAWDESPEAVRTQRDLMSRLRGQVLGTTGVQKTVMEWPVMYYPGIYTVHAGDVVGGATPATASLVVQRAENGHFDVLGIPIRSGRAFGPADVAAARTASEAPVIISTDLAALMWGSADAVGRRLQTMSDSTSRSARVSRVASGLRTLVVVGVIDDPAARNRVKGESYRIYLPMDTVAPPESMLIRTAVAAAPLLPSLRGLAQKAAPSTIISARTMAQIEAESNSTRRMVSGAISAAGIAALILSAIGLYAVIAFSVAQRTQEIAVRLAVGARGNQIAYSFVGDGLRLGAIGLLLGLPAGMFAVRQFITMLDMGELPLVPIILIASIGIFVVSAASGWAPARRAATVDPATALRRG